MCVKSLSIVVYQNGNGKFQGIYSFPSQSNVFHFQAVLGKKSYQIIV